MNPETIAAWRQHVFCMIAPDCLHRGLTSALLDRFHAAGVEPTGWSLARIGTHRIDVMSQIQTVAPGGVYRYRALDTLFELGPALVVVLRDRNGRTAEELYGALNELKGNADPSRAEPGTLRHDLGAVNVVLSLLHISDSPEHSARECAVLTGLAVPSDYRDAPGLRQVVAILEATQPRENRGLPAVLAAVRGRALAKLWDLLPAPDRDQVSALAQKGRLGYAPLPEDILGRLDAAGADPVLTGFLRAPFSGDGLHPDLPAVHHRLTADGQGLDPWEYAVLETSVYFASRRIDPDD
jgi:nucleoside diphosphate kinase